MISMSRWYPFAVVAVLGIPSTAACQESAPASSTVGISLGVSDFHEHDDNLSPITYRGSIPSLGATYERRGARTLVAFEATYALGHTNSEVLPRDVQQHVAHVSFTVLRALGAPKPNGRGLTFFLGGGASTLGAVTDLIARDAATNYSYRDWSYFWAHSLDLAARAELRRGPRSVALQVSGSVFRLDARPNNGKDYNAENARVTDSWPRSLLGGSPRYAWDRPVLSARAEYRQRLGRRLQLWAACDFTYAASARPQPVGLYMNHLQLGLLRGL